MTTNTATKRYFFTAKAFGRILCEHVEAADENEAREKALKAVDFSFEIHEVKPQVWNEWEE